MTLQVLHLDNHCVAVDKPAGTLVQGDATGDPTLVAMLQAELKQRFRKPGRVFVGIVHRLDRPVSGVVLFARTSKGAARLSAAFRDGRARKLYVALVTGSLPRERDVLRHALVKDGRRNTSRVADPEAAGARPAELEYVVLGQAARGTLVAVWPRTGRPHQIRVQLAATGAPILGDLRYGAPEGLGSAIALHAARLHVPHPTRGAPLDIHAPIPGDWDAWLGSPGRERLETFLKDSRSLDLQARPSQEGDPGWCA